MKPGIVIDNQYSGANVVIGTTGQVDIVQCTGGKYCWCRVMPGAVDAKLNSITCHY